MLLTSDDMAGLDVDLSPVRGHVISLILESLYFFRDLTKQQQDELAKCLKIEYYEAGQVIFEEDDAGDSMQIMLEGSVKMIKRAGLSAHDTHIATFRPNQERPWFGELAMLANGKRRTCAAVCAEKCKTLVCSYPDFMPVTTLEWSSLVHEPFEYYNGTWEAFCNPLERERRSRSQPRAGGAIAAPVMLLYDRENDLLHAAGDPRAGRHAAVLQPVK